MAVVMAATTKNNIGDDLRSSAVSALDDDIDDDVWDEVVRTLEITGGVATVHLPSPIETIHMEAFETAKEALEEVASFQNTKQQQASSSSSSLSSSIFIPENSDSAHVSGYHGAGSSNSLSRYNQYREGFVFSDGDSIKIDAVPMFETKMDTLQQSLQGIARQVLLATERRYDLPLHWFETTFGPTESSSQWHIKRYVTTHHNNNNDNDKDDGTRSIQSGLNVENDEIQTKEPTILLPMHTDPSIISVVIHDAKGTNPTGLGLQYQGHDEEQYYDDDRQKGKKRMIWKEVPYHGHAVATIFVGSVLSYITGGICPSVKHRVIQQQQQPLVLENGRRMAATLFLRPHPKAILQVLPSPTFQNIHIKKNVSFGAWMTKVSKNYSKKKKSEQTQ